jgi:nicotinamidase-related amidase
MDLNIRLRTRNKVFKNGGKAEVFYLDKFIDCKKIALLSIGMWSMHKCQVATDRLNEISIKANSLMKLIRNNGGRIIHGSSTLVNLPEYKHMRNNIFGLPQAKLIDHGMVSFPPVPIDDSDGGIVEKNPNYDRKKVLMNPYIDMDYEKDAISGHNKEILNYLHHHNIELLLICGTHANMCVLDRIYGIKNIVRYGFPVVLIRDLVDVVHNPKLHPYTNREQTNELMAEWIEEYVCPTVHSEDILFHQKDKKIIYVDIDDTICHGEGKLKYENPEPIQINLDRINKLYDLGNTIIYWTARGCVSNKDWLEKTRKQLNNFGAKYHTLRVGKPNYDLFICDKTINLTYNLDIEQYINK